MRLKHRKVDNVGSVLGRRSDFKTPPVPRQAAASAPPQPQNQQHKPQLPNQQMINPALQFSHSQNQPAFSLPASIPSAQFGNGMSGFGSEQANLEYAMLSSMLNAQPSPSESSHSGQGNGSFSAYTDPTSGFDLSSFSQSPLPLGAASTSYFNAFSQMPPSSTTPGFPQASPSSQLQSGTSSNAFLQNTASPLHGMPDQSTSMTPSFAPPNAQVNSRPTLQPNLSHSSTGYVKPPTPAVPPTPALSPSGAMKAEDVYRMITKPYPYAQSYHDLIRHLKDRLSTLR